MKKLKHEIYLGTKIMFGKHYKYISPDYPATPFVKAYINNDVVGQGLTKAEAFQSAKNYIEKKRYGQSNDEYLKTVK